MLLATELQQDYQVWTPTWANLTMGASTSTGWYVRLGGRWIVFEATLTLGAGFAFTGSGNLRCNLPIKAASSPQLPVPPQFNGRFIRPAAEFRPIFFDTSADADNAPYALAWLTTGTYATWTYVTSTIPMTWQAADKLIVHGRYLAESPI